MNKKITVIIFSLLVTLFVITSCDNPKSLAKQYYKLEQQWWNTNDRKEEAKLETQMEKLLTKMEKMSEKNKKLFKYEYDQLDK